MYTDNSRVEGVTVYTVLPIGKSKNIRNWRIYRDLIRMWSGVGVTGIVE